MPDETSTPAEAAPVAETPVLETTPVTSAELGEIKAPTFAELDSTASKFEPDESFGTKLGKLMDGVKDPGPTETPATPAAETKTETPAEITPADAAEPPAKLSPKAAESWRKREQEFGRKLQSSVDSAKSEVENKYKAELDKYKTELEAARNNPEIQSIKAEKQSLEEKLKVYEQEIKVYRVEKSPDFIAAFTQPLQEMDAQFDAFAKKYDIPASAIRDAVVSNDDSKIEDVLAVMSSEKDKLRLLSASEKYSDILQRRQKVIESADLMAKRLEENRTKEENSMRESFKKSHEEALNKQLQSIEEDVPILKNSESKEWNALLDQARTVAKGIDVASLSHDERAAAITRAAFFPLVWHALQRFAKDNQSLQAKIDSLSAATPKGGVPPEAPAVTDTEGMSLGTLAAAKFGNGR